MNLLKSLLLGLTLTGCLSSKAVIIPENAKVSELLRLDKCYFNLQCERIGAGYKFCSHIEEGAEGTLNYSTLIGSA